MNDTVTAMSLLMQLCFNFNIFSSSNILLPHTHTLQSSHTNKLLFAHNLIKACAYFSRFKKAIVRNYAIFSNFDIYILWQQDKFMNTIIAIHQRR